MAQSALISAVFPLVLAAAVDPGWTTLLWTGARAEACSGRRRTRIARRRADENAASLAATLKPDAMAVTLRDAVKSCLAAAQGQEAEQQRFSVVAASAA
jgi:hypothetical protein